jgi:hypothetical protein
VQLVPTMTKHEFLLFGICFILAPALFFISGFFWSGVEYGVTGGTIVNLGAACWIPVFIGLFNILKQKLPAYASWALPIAILGCVAGANFAMVGVNAAIFQLPHQVYLDGYAKNPLSANLLLFWTGPLFPLSLIFLSIQLMRTRSLELWTLILMGLGAIAFPISRIARNHLITHAADFLLLIPFVYLGIRYIRTGIEMPQKKTITRE